jgi:hypothetical protein
VMRARTHHRHARPIPPDASFVGWASVQQ